MVGTHHLHHLFRRTFDGIELKHDAFDPQKEIFFNVRCKNVRSHLTFLRMANLVLRGFDLHFLTSIWTISPLDLRDVTLKLDERLYGDHLQTRPVTGHETLLCRKVLSLLRKNIGELVYLARFTRPYKSFAVYAPTRSIHAPIDHHSVMISVILRSITSTPILGISYNSKPKQQGLWCFSFADLGGCLETRHSKTVFVIQMNYSAV